MTTLGNAATPDELLDLIRRRQHESGLSNKDFAELCGFTIAQVDKYLGPTRPFRWAPKLQSLFWMLDGLGLSLTVYIDPAKVERFRKVRGTHGKRMAQYANDKNGRISKALVKRATPLVLAANARKGGLAKWKKSTPAQRKQVAQYLAKHRWGK